MRFLLIAAAVILTSHCPVSLRVALPDVERSAATGGLGGEALQRGQNLELPKASGTLLDVGGLGGVALQRGQQLELPTASATLLDVVNQQQTIGLETFYATPIPTSARALDSVFPACTVVLGVLFVSIVCASLAAKHSSFTPSVPQAQAAQPASAQLSAVSMLRDAKQSAVAMSTTDRHPTAYLSTSDMTRGAVGLARAVSAIPEEALADCAASGYAYELALGEQSPPTRGGAGFDRVCLPRTSLALQLVDELKAPISSGRCSSSMPDLHMG